MYLGMVIAGFGILYNTAWAALGIPVFLSGALGWCPSYSLFHFKSFGKADEQQ